jgi:hypothetical protein
MPWLRGEASGIPGRRTANLQRDRKSRLESPPFRAVEDVNWISFTLVVYGSGPGATRPCHEKFGAGYPG